MNYHGIENDSMLNGDGIRVCLWCSGCDHHCKNCHNPQTWDKNGGMLFDKKAEEQLFLDLDKDYVSGVTFTGGDPLNENNVETILHLCEEFRSKFGSTKTIWIYSGYYLNDIMERKNAKDDIRIKILRLADVFVDGPFIQELADVNYPHAGSTNQNVIVLKNIWKEETV